MANFFYLPYSLGRCLCTRHARVSTRKTLGRLMYRIYFCLIQVSNRVASCLSGVILFLRSCSFDCLPHTGCSAGRRPSGQPIIPSSPSVPSWRTWKCPQVLNILEPRPGWGPWSGWWRCFTRACAHARAPPVLSSLCRDPCHLAPSGVSAVPAVLTPAWVYSFAGSRWIICCPC